MDTRNVKDMMEEFALGKEGVRKKHHQAELERERELAAIRAQSHALIWTGTAEELIGTISRWYESGCLLAESAQDALQKAAIHFVDTEGKPIIKPTAQTQPTPTAKGKTSRKAFVIPLLEAKGWSILDWANEADVSHATAIDYLEDKRTPYRSTRLKLANALNVRVDQLPK